jgi:short-subunit dehydrogenase
MQLSGSTVLLTGATGGLGQAIAHALKERGAQLILTGRRTDVLEPLAAELGARTLAVDLSIAAEVDRLVREAGQVDVLVANAALPSSGRLDSFSMQEIDRALDVNLRAPIALAHALLPAMIERRSGHLLFMSSLAGKVATPGTSMYNATKYGLRGFAARTALAYPPSSPASSATPACSPTPGSSCPQASAPARRRMSPRPSSRRSSATAARSTSRPSPCA